MISYFTGTRVCPRSDAHEPHDERAFFCWVCGDELVCETCGVEVAKHEWYREARCPVVRLRLSPV